MKIALTKKLADAIGINFPTVHKDENAPENLPENARENAQENLSETPPKNLPENPLFSWTANWTNVWDNGTEDVLVLVNNATRFIVAIYPFSRKNLKNAAQIIRAAIPNTLLYMNLNPELVEGYLRLAGEIEFVQNHDRKAAAWVTHAGLECAFYIGNDYNKATKTFRDTVGVPANYRFVNYLKKSEDRYAPYQAMISALCELTGKQAYKYRAFELLVTLDLEIYKATRRIIVPANLEFQQLHKVLQSVFNWYNYHLYDFTILDDENHPVARLVPFEEDLEYDPEDILMEEHTISEYLPEYRHILYRYDMGDGWEHEIQLIRILEDYDKESPYLVEASGQAPPEDVGGIGGFLDFYEIMSNPDHPEYEEMEKWSHYWTIELSERKKQPRVIYSYY